jgi:uncharacterized C2H2 Zn-finger protein
MAKTFIKCRACGAVLPNRKAMTEHGKRVHPMHRGKRIAQTRKAAGVKWRAKYARSDYPL